MRGTKGAIFTIDAILAITLIAILMILLPTILPQTTPIRQASLVASDAINVLAEIEMSEFNQSYLDSLNGGGNVSATNSVLEQLGIFWTENNTQDAENLTRTVFGDILHNYQLRIGNTLIYGTGNASGTIAVGKRTVSGITSGRSATGFISRAIALKVAKSTADVHYFHPQGSGNDGGIGMTITKNLNVNATSINNATFYISIHYGNSNINSMRITVNGNDIGLDQDDWLYNNESPLDSSTHVAFTKADVTSLITTGENTVEIELRSQNSGHAHLHPGTRLEILYNTTGLYEVKDTFTVREYFDNILSEETGSKRSGAWATMPINIPLGATVTNASLHLVANDIEGYSQNQVNSRGKGDGCDDVQSGEYYNLRGYLNNDSIFLENEPSWLSGESIDETFDLTSDVSVGNNVVSVYLNTYGDCFWGDGDSILYADATGDASGSSYVEYTYTRSPLTQEFGKIDVVVPEEFGTNASNDVTRVYNMTGEVFNSYVSLATLETDVVNLSMNGDLSFQTPRPLATPSSVFIDNGLTITPGLNTITVQDCSGCEILGESSYYYQILVPNLVGFGDVFDTEQEALDDASERLEEVLGSAVEALEIDEETIGIGGVPSLWGPTIIEVRTWV